MTACRLPWQRAGMSDKSPSQRTWGGRFGGKPSELMREINASIRFDKRLWREDIAASKAHAAMLREQGIISEADAAAILEGLDRIAAEYERDGVPESEELEDIHMTVEHRLGELIGEAAGRLHTARSRNDQVATDFRLWVRNACDEAADAVRTLQRALVGRADEHADSDHARLHAYAGRAAGDARPSSACLLRDAAPRRVALHRRAGADEREPARVARRSPAPASRSIASGPPMRLGSSGRPRTASMPSPTAISRSSICRAAAQCSLHLSRLAEELILWASPMFGFVKLSDEYSTGSSIMPQKRNPDAAELVRGHSGRIVGALPSLMVTMKGLPLAYSKDMQDDKEPVFEAHDLLMISLQALAGMIETVEFVPERMREAAERAFQPRPISPTGWCARPTFRSAKRTTSPARAVKLAEERGCGLADLSIDDLKASIRASTTAFSPCSASRPRSPAAPAMAEPHRPRPRADREG